METKTHWEQIYSQKSTNEMSWTQERPDVSLQLISQCGLDKDAAIIDVGGGRSTLTSFLIAEGYTNLSVLDISGEALNKLAENLGAKAEIVTRIESNILEFIPPQTYDLWHDRAVLHFLTNESDVAQYLSVLNTGLKSGGYLVLATFALDGPEKCSGLPVQRYGSAELTTLLGNDFEALTFEQEIHHTPFQTKQSFQYGLFRKK